MQAKSKRPYPVTAFAAREFVGYEWRVVPDGYEEEARRLEAAGVLELQEFKTAVDTELGDGPEGSLAVDLESKTVRELQAIARDMDVSYSGLTKAELIDALRID